MNALAGLITRQHPTHGPNVFPPPFLRATYHAWLQDKKQEKVRVMSCSLKDYW
jgi:hypothetical protein